MKKVILIIMLLGAQVVTAQKGQSNHGSPPTVLSRYIEGSPYQITCAPKSIDDNLQLYLIEQYSDDADYYASKQGYLTLTVVPNKTTSLIRIRGINGELVFQDYSNNLKVDEDDGLIFGSDTDTMTHEKSIGPKAMGWVYSPEEGSGIVIFDEVILSFDSCGGRTNALGDGLDI
jgi:hypothetical protein